MYKKFIEKDSKYLVELDLIIKDYNEKTELKLNKIIKNEVYGSEDNIYYSLIGGRPLRLSEVKDIIENTCNITDVDILNSYITKMFGVYNDEEGEPYIDVYVHEFRGVLEQLKYYKTKGLSMNQFEGAVAVELMGILADRDFDRFKEDGLKYFSEKIYKL